MTQAPEVAEAGDSSEMPATTDHDPKAPAEQPVVLDQPGTEHTDEDDTARRASSAKGTVEPQQTAEPEADANAGKLPPDASSSGVAIQDASGPAASTEPLQQQRQPKKNPGIVKMVWQTCKLLNMEV